MALKVRLWQQGSTNSICYRIVIADSRFPRDGKYLEAIGWYNPNNSVEQQKSALDATRLQYWLSVGAQMTQTVEAVAKQIVPDVIKQFIASKEARKMQKAAKRKVA